MPRGCRSATEYRFGDEHTDSIVRTAAYHRKDFCLSVIWFSSREHIDIRPSIATPFRRTSNVGLGSLDRLPLELLYNTLLGLDMHSLFKFRQTNLTSRQTVDSLKQYQMVVSHGLNLLCASLRTRLAIGISLLDFYNALCTKASMLLQCLKGAPEIQVQTRTAVRKQFHLTKVELDQLRSFKTLPEIYSMTESVQQPHALLQAQPASSERNQKFNFMGSCALPYYDKRTSKVEHGMSCAGCQLALEKDIVGARSESWAFEARDKVYARDGFLEHFRWCEQAQVLWRSSGEGSKRPTELPEVARRGGSFNMRE
ncbi:hypothetical protein DL95DRAFT_434583 [Leptodontidium sp. 2 PMI_412]|nr:hypothetical protein DL95DRAFT_434583 [Leptodontidium sp. 2 PMI_412]